jgi:hypothetical protein
VALKLKKLSGPETTPPNPAALLQMVREADPTSPPAKVSRKAPEPEQPPGAETSSATAEESLPIIKDPQVGLNIRVRLSTSNAVEAAAAARGVTMKVLVMETLAQAGIEIADPDLRDRSPRRRKGEPKSHK